MKRLLLAGGLLVLFSSGLAATTPEKLQTVTLAAVTYLNGSRIHAENCRINLTGDHERQLEDALGAASPRSRAALGRYIDDIYLTMKSTAPANCIPGMLTSFQSGFAEKLGELRRLRNAGQARR